LAPENDDREQQTEAEQQQSAPDKATSKPESRMEQNQVAVLQPEETSLQPSDISAADDDPPAITKDEARIEQECEKLIVSAKTKMKNKDYSGAYSDLLIAMAKKPTDEAFNLMEQCREDIVKERLAKYDIFTIDFGDLKIVRNRETGLFGAINAKGEEIISCDYIDVSKSTNGRAFMRKDGKYDLYTADGDTLTKKMQTFD
jgi:hypothetical protein